VTQILYILLGWLLGLLAPAIVERIRRGRRSKELVTALCADLDELRFQMAFITYTMRSRTDGINREWFHWFAPIARSYSGSNSSPVLTLLLQNGDTFSDDMWKAFSGSSDPNIGMSLKQYSAALLAAHATELATLPIKFQISAMQVRSRLDLFNQHVSHLQRQFDLTFTASGDFNKAALRTNLEKGYTQLDAIAKRVADAITDVPGLELNPKKK
jgi:hypothetical protein